MRTPRSFALSFFASKHAARAEVRELSWAQVCDLSFYAEPSEAAKEALPMWSPARFAGKPLLENVTSIAALVLDVDGSTPSRIDTVTRMPFACIAHASFSHTPAVEKFRLLARTSRPHTAAEHPALWRYAQLVLRSVGVEADAKARDASRRYFVPVKHAHYGVSFNWGQLPLDVDAALAFMRGLESQKASQPEASLARRAPLRSGGVSARDRAARYLATVDPSVSGQGGHGALYRAACCLVRGFGLDPSTALDLLLSDFNPRCGPQWSVHDIERKVDQAGKASLPVGYLLDREVAA